MTNLTMIVAHSKNRAIGKDNKLLWSIPNDLKYFKQITEGNTIVMGRKTYESIGRPLPNRVNVVLTTDNNFKRDGIQVINSIDEIFNLAGNVIVIGGDSIYRQLIDYSSTLFVTEIEEDFEGDTYFPEIDASEWQLVSSKKGVKDKANPYDYYFNTYRRRPL